MLKLLLLGGAIGVPVLSAASPSLDVGSLVAAYGTAAPFAALCLWQMQKLQKERDEVRKENSALHDAALRRERELVGQVAPMIYDGARLYERGNERLRENSTSMQDVDKLAQQVQALVERLDDR